MIQLDNINADWLNAVSKKNHNTDKILIEKVIRALLLVEGLARYGLPFIFKGGTALMLHLNSAKRLSIDIDIILYKDVDRLDALLDAVAKDQGFLLREPDDRIASSAIKKSHHKFYYTPIHRTNKEEEYVLLDILFEEVKYSRIEQLPIQSGFIPGHGLPVMVDVPSLESILGDKLTAFAPYTTGIPYVKNEHSMSMEIIKQLYDIGSLRGVVNDLDIVKETFNTFAKTELAYRNAVRIDEHDVLDDIFQTSLCLVSRGADGKGEFAQLALGIQRVRNFIFSESYHLEKAIVHASYAAYLATSIKYDAGKIEKFIDPSQIKDWYIAEPLNVRLNRLKKSNPEAFFYWYKVYELQSG